VLAELYLLAVAEGVHRVQVGDGGRLVKALGAGAAGWVAMEASAHRPAGAGGDLEDSRWDFVELDVGRVKIDDAVAVDEDVALGFLGVVGPLAEPSEREGGKFSVVRKHILFLF